MSDRLVPCPSCSRHVRVVESSCPFCLEALSEALRTGPVPVPPPAGLSRGGIARYGALGTKALAGAVVGTSMLAACSDQGTFAAAYGIACDPCDYGYQDGFVLADAEVGDGAEDQGVAPDGHTPSDARADAPTSDGQGDAPADAHPNEGGDAGHGDGSAEAGTTDGSSEVGLLGSPDAPPG